MSAASRAGTMLEEKLNRSDRTTVVQLADCQFQQDPGRLRWGLGVWVRIDCQQSSEPGKVVCFYGI